LRLDAVHELLSFELTIGIQVKPSDNSNALVISRQLLLPFEEIIEVFKVDVAVVPVINCTVEPVLDEVLHGLQFLFQCFSLLMHLNFRKQELSQVSLDVKGKVVEFIDELVRSLSRNSS